VIIGPDILLVKLLLIASRYIIYFQALVAHHELSISYEYTLKFM
jgi:hypothetical protein